MRALGLGALVGGAVTLALATSRTAGDSTPLAYGTFSPGAQHGLIAHFAAGEGKPHTVAVVDPQQKVLAVLHVDATTGAISLKSVRNLSWDLQMPQFNSDSPSPQDVRRGLEEAR